MRYVWRVVTLGVLLISVGVNLVQFQNAKAAQQHYVPGLWNTYGFLQGDCVNTAKDFTLRSPNNLAFANESWSEATGELRGAIPQLEQLGIPARELNTVMQEFLWTKTNLPPDNRLSHGLNHQYQTDFNEAKRFIALASTTLPLWKHANSAQEFARVKNAFNVLAKKGAFILPGG